MAIFWAVSPHLLSQNGKIWREGANLGDPPPCQILQKLVKGRLRHRLRHTRLWQNYTKN